MATEKQTALREAEQGSLAAGSAKAYYAPQTHEPAKLTSEERLQAAVASGELEWGGGRFRVEPPSVTLPEGESLADLLTEVRGC